MLFRSGYVDFYYNELYKNEINQYIQEMIAPYILDNQIEVNIYALKSKEISKKTFEDKENIIIMIKDNHKLDTDHIIDASKELHSKLPLIKRVHFYFASDNERYFNVEFESQYFTIRNNKLRERVDY